MKIDISDFAWKYLQQNARPFIDTEPSSVLDRLLTEHQRGLPTSLENDAFDDGALTQAEVIPDVTHTEVLSAQINGRRVTEKSWQHVLIAVLDESAKIASAEHIRTLIFLNNSAGNHCASGYYYSEGLDVTVQGSAANRIKKQIQKICDHCDLSVQVRVRWFDKEGAYAPGKIATLDFSS